MRSLCISWMAAAFSNHLPYTLLVIASLVARKAHGIVLASKPHSHHESYSVQAEARKEAQVPAPSISPEEVVCISVPVFEEPTYVNAFLKNALFFTEPSTKIALHLNPAAEYAYEHIAAWDADASGRVAVTPERVRIEPIGGHVLNAHLLNYQTLEKRWPNTCNYYTMQASNMWWVRHGMESVVRQKKYAHLLVQGQKMSLAQKFTYDGDFWNELTKGRKMMGWGPPEGAYFPMRMMKDFMSMFDGWLQRTGQDRQAAIDKVQTYVEAYWLQTYALNYEEKTSEMVAAKTQDNSVCYRHMWGESNPDDCQGSADGMGCFTAVYNEDSVPLNEVKDLVEGRPVINDVLDNKTFPVDHYFAVKRVNRNMSHPTTQYIMSLAQ